MRAVWDFQVTPGRGPLLRMYCLLLAASLSKLSPSLPAKTSVEMKFIQLEAVTPPALMRLPSVDLRDLDGMVERWIQRR